MISYNEGVLNDHGLLLVCDLNWCNILDLPYDHFPDFNFDDLETTVYECLPEFRFHKRDLTLLAELYNEVNELINSKCLIRLARQISGQLIKM